MADNNIIDITLDSSTILTQQSVNAQATSPTVDVSFQKEKTKELNRFNRTTFQARMGRRLDRISRRVTDNNIRLSSNPTDMIRVTSVRDDRSQDLVSRRITATDVLPLMLPKMEDVPLRHFVRKGDEVMIPSLYTIEQQEYFEVYAPVEVKLEPDDLLFRLIYDPSADEPYVMCLQVKEQLATIGYSSINYLKYWVTFYDEPLPAKVIEILKNANIKRDLLGW